MGMVCSTSRFVLEIWSLAICHRETVEPGWLNLVKVLVDTVTRAMSSPLLGGQWMPCKDTHPMLLY